MLIALYDYDKDKMANLLDKNITSFQKIEALYKLNRLKEMQEEIYKLNPDALLYKTYFDSLKNGNFFSYDVEIIGSFLINKIKLRQNPYLLEVNNIEKNNEIIFSRFFNSFLIGIGYNDKLLLKLSKKERVKNIEYNFYAFYHKNDLSIDIANNKIINIKQDSAGIDLNFRDFLFRFNYSKNFYNRDIFFKTLLELNYEKNLNLFKETFFDFYIKNVNYSNMFDTFSESGIGIVFKEPDTSSKKFKFFVNPLIFYNTLSNIGYKLTFGLDKRVIKADNLKIVFILSKDEKEVKVSYIYFY
jgi:hypothetical protein